MVRRTAVSMAMLAALAASSACTVGHDSAASSTPSADVSPTPTAPVVTGEPAGAVALVRRADRASWAGAGDGSLLLAYNVPGRRCYFRRVMPNDRVIGWFGERGTYCPRLFGFDGGFLGIDGVDPQRRSQDLSVPGAPVEVKSEYTGREPSGGDIYLGWCTDLTDDDADDASPLAAALGCAYAPKSRSLYQMRDALDIDPHGRGTSPGSVCTRRRRQRTLLVVLGTESGGLPVATLVAAQRRAGNLPLTSGSL